MSTMPVEPMVWLWYAVVNPPCIPCRFEPRGCTTAPLLLTKLAPWMAIVPS